MVQLYIKEENQHNPYQRIVKNSYRRDVFIVEGKWGQKNDRIRLYTVGGQCLVDVKQLTLSVFPKFRVKMNGKTVAYIKKKPRLLRSPVYHVTRLGWKAAGNYFKREYTVKKNQEVIMEVDKAVTTFGDFYSLDISKPEDAPLCCVLAVMIDHYSINKNRNYQALDQGEGILQREG